MSQNPKLVEALGRALDDYRDKTIRLAASGGKRDPLNAWYKSSCKVSKLIQQSLGFPQAK